MDLAAHLADMFNILIKMFLKEKIKKQGAGGQALLLKQTNEKSTLVFRGFY